MTKRKPNVLVLFEAFIQRQSNLNEDFKTSLCSHARRIVSENIEGYTIADHINPERGAFYLLQVIAKEDPIAVEALFMNKGE
jgi:hypothetical protein